MPGARCMLGPKGAPLCHSRLAGRLHIAHQLCRPGIIAVVNGFIGFGQPPQQPLICSALKAEGVGCCRGAVRTCRLHKRRHAAGWHCVLNGRSASAIPPFQVISWVALAMQHARHRADMLVVQAER